MKVIFSGGGTGGHVYPALAVATALAQELGDSEPLDALYVGTTTGIEKDLVDRAGLPFRAVAAGAIRGRSPWGLAASLVKLTRGVAQARRAIAQFQPHAILTTGGYASVPTALAARTSSRSPLVVYLPDVRPGWALRLMARLSRRVAVSTDRSLSYLPIAKTVVTGYPVRAAFSQVTKTEARRRLAIDPQDRLLLITGATHGARSLNRMVADHLPQLLELCQIIHLSGHRDEPRLNRWRRDLPDRLRPRYHLYGYLHEDFPWAMAAADLALMRAGASVMGELPAVGLPAILVPYPYAGGHQVFNARFLADAGAAIVVEDNKLNGLLPLVGELLADEPRRAAMTEAARRLARPDAATNIARLLMEVAK
ncbi:MAG: UDP-N-acetylglucosamine--N-acetylmuramyl-(pentapeptide) pyrophosphoryl-undecaprenol N-acetylglucosamine transferase [Dehalococcoidia bacterium]|nr:MAG: UDP-N-acetylglucosamine--N-acetylmuramyl-(pentapeptide) pyrophosphoryl-undecaprenol N-acetylglucosamine transferase [Dehalococcoidia bacterium]